MYTLQEAISRATFAYRVARVEEQAAANVLYVNGVILHLDHTIIPDSHAVSIYIGVGTCGKGFASENRGNVSSKILTRRL